MAKKWLITGAAGFIGSHTTEAFLRRGDAVVGLDNLNPYYDPAHKRRNLEEVRENHPDADFTFVEGDIRDDGDLERVFGSGPFDGVVHLAAMGGVRYSIEKPELYLDVNTVGTQRLLQKIVDTSTPHLVFASTSSVYGATTRIPFVEGDPCDTPLAPYAASKRAAEMLSYTYAHLFGHTTTVLRFFTVYGPRNRPDMMAFKLLASMDGGPQVPLYADGEMWRDWTFVGDIVEGIVAAADQPGDFQTLNIGRGEPVHLGAFVERLEALAGKRANVKSTTRPSTDVVKTWADVSRTRERLGYQPSTSLEEGTAALFDWYQRTFSAAD